MFAAPQINLQREKEKNRLEQEKHSRELSQQEMQLSVCKLSRRGS